MRLYSIAALAFLAVIPSSCDTKSTLEQIQAATVQACGFLPTAVMIAGVVPAATPYAAPAGVIAQAICDAVTATSGPKMAARRSVGSTRTVSIKLPNGQKATVSGKFVR